MAADTQADSSDEPELIRSCLEAILYSACLIVRRWQVPHTHIRARAYCGIHTHACARVRAHTAENDMRRFCHDLKCAVVFTHFLCIPICYSPTALLLFWFPLALNIHYICRVCQMSRQYLELTQSQERGCFMSLFTLCGSRIAILWPGKRGNGLSVALCGWLWVKCFHSLQAVSFPVTSSNKVGTKKWRSQRASIVPVYQWLTVSWGLCVPLFIWGNSCE